MSKIKYYIFIFLSILFFVNLHASVLLLDNGDILTGKIIKETNEEFIFENDFGRLNIKKKTVKSVILNEKSLSLISFEDKGKKYKGRVLVRSEKEIVYLLENNTIYRYNRDKKGQGFPHVIGLSFSSGLINFPEPVFRSGSDAEVVLSRPEFIWGVFLNYSYYFSFMSIGVETGVSKLNYKSLVKRPVSDWKFSYNWHCSRRCSRSSMFS